MSDPNRVGEDLPNWSPRQPERIADLKRSRESRPGRFAPWERDIAFLIGFYEAALENLDDPVAVVRRGVESGTIKGYEADVVLDEYEGLYGFLGTDGFVVMPDEGRYLVIPVSDGGSET